MDIPLMDHIFGVEDAKIEMTLFDTTVSIDEDQWTFESETTPEEAWASLRCMYAFWRLKAHG